MSALLTPLVGPTDHRLGPADAPLTLVEYGDFECPHCGAAYSSVEAVRRRLGGRLRFVFRHFPLARSHPHAEHAAEMAEAAADRGKFWPMHAVLFENQAALDDEALVHYAASVGVDPVWAASELLSHACAGRVREHFMSGVRSGVNGTPTFFINGVRHDGASDELSLLEALRSAATALPRP
jgi:protein-disulfide isomerase